MISDKRSSLILLARTSGSVQRTVWGIYMLMCEGLKLQVEMLGNKWSDVCSSRNKTLGRCEEHSKGYVIAMYQDSSNFTASLNSPNILRTSYLDARTLTQQPIFRLYRKSKSSSVHFVTLTFSFPSMLNGLSMPQWRNVCCVSLNFQPT